MLDSVDWGAAYERLFRAAPRPVLGVAGWYVRHSEWLGPAPMSFAVFVVRSAPHLVREAVGAGPVAAWLTATCRAALATVQTLPTRTFPAAGPLYVDPRLPVLPLLGAAVEHAAATAGRLGVYLAEDLPPGIGGRCRTGPVPVVLPDGREEGAIVIEISERENVVFAWAVEVWLHELAHALDPERDQRTSEEREDYADRLGPRLALLAEDAPLAVVRPLAERTYAEVRQTYRAAGPALTSRASASGVALRHPLGAGLPAPGVESLAALAVLPLLVGDSRP